VRDSAAGARLDERQERQARSNRGSALGGQTPDPQQSVKAKVKSQILITDSRAVDGICLLPFALHALRLRVECPVLGSQVLKIRNPAGR